MAFKLLSKLTFLAASVFVIAGCENQTTNSVTKSADETSNDSAETRRYTPFDVSRSVTSISPDLYKQLVDTLNVRILQGTYKPGDSSIMHAHPDFALYVLEAGTVELTAEDGGKQNVEFKKDMAVVLPAATHSAKNIGNTTLRLIVMEVNRPRD